MKTTASKTLRRSLYGVFAGSAIGGVAAAALAVPTATAAPDRCAASEIARTIGSVSTNTGNYLDSHPDTNTALTYAAQQPVPQAVASLKTYFDANPRVGTDLQTIQQPLTGLTGQCKLPISIPQALQLLQAAAQSGGLAGAGAQNAGVAGGGAQNGGLAGAGAQNAGLPGGGALPGQLPSLPGAAAASVPAGSGSVPGPVTATTPTAPVSLH